MVRKYQFPWRAKNQFRLLVDAHRFFPAMLEAIKQARDFVLFEQYLVQSGQILSQFIDQLLDAHSRGVRIYMLLDDYGSRTIQRNDYLRLLNAGIELTYYNPLSWRSLYRSLRRDHRKLLIVDNRVAYVGGAGISDDYIQNESPYMNWHDVMLEIQGECVEDWIQAFMTVWQQSTKRLPVIADYQRAAVGEQTGRIHLSRGMLGNDIMRSVIAHIRKSNHRVWLSTPYFVTNRKLRRALRRAAQYKVDVRLLLPGPISDHPWVSNAGRRYYQKLLLSGVKIFEYQPRFVHAKVILCDDWVSVGSSNLDRWNQRWNLDANQAVLDAVFSEKVSNMFETDFAQSRQISHEVWQKRSLWQHVQESFSGFFVSALQWFNYIITRLNK